MEFKDERIDSACARIYRNGMIIATLITFAYALVRFFYLESYNCLQFKHMITEFSVAICSIIILIVGFIKFNRNKDERTEYEKAKFYLNGAKIFLFVMIYAYAISMLLSRNVENAELHIKLFMNLMLSVTLIYVYYNFRKNGIEINYSIIQASKGEYFLYVLKNICIFILAAVIPLGIAAVLDEIIYKSDWYLVFRLLSGLESILLIVIEYFIISLVEKLQYDDDRPVIFKKGLWIFATIFIVICSINGLRYFVVSVINDLGLNRTTPYEEIIYYINKFLYERDYVTIFDLSLVTMPLLCTIFAELGDSKILKVIKAWTITIIIYLTQTKLIMTILNEVKRDSAQRLVYSDVMTVVSITEYILLLIPIVMLFYGLFRLIKIHEMSKSLILIPVLMLLWIIGIILRTEFGANGVFEYVDMVCNFVSQLAVCIIFYRAIKKFDKNRLQNSTDMI